VRYSSFWRDRYDRFKWLDSSVQRDWYPQILPSGETRHIHLILENTRWDQKEDFVMTCRLEVLSSESREWKVCATYTELAVGHDAFESGDSFELPPSAVQART
jgi:hypothetical protein